MKRQLLFSRIRSSPQRIRGRGANPLGQIVVRRLERIRVRPHQLQYIE